MVFLHVTVFCDFFVIFLIHICIVMCNVKSLHTVATQLSYNVDVMSIMTPEKTNFKGIKGIN